MGKENFAELASQILDNVGGKENVSSVTHCMTRLRLTLKDESQVENDRLNKIPQILSVVKAGGQTQIVIGPTVDEVYAEVIKIGGFKEKKNLDIESNNSNVENNSENNSENPKNKFSLKKIGNGIMNGLSGSITPVLPVFIVSGIMKMFTFLLGPDIFNLLSNESDPIRLLNIVGDSGYYFLPVFIAYSAAKHFGASRVLSLLISVMLIHPDMLAIVQAGDPFTVFGIPMVLVNYVQSVIPIILNVWILSYVERWVKKIVPDTLRTLGIPVLSILIMLPIILCIVGPFTSLIMNGVANIIIWLANTVGILAISVVGGIWTLVVATGMHVPILTALLPANMEIGFDPIVSPGTIASGFASLAVAMGYGLRAAKKEDRSIGWGFFITYAFGKVSEPMIYGLLLRNKKALAWSIIGGFSGGLVMGLIDAKVYIFSSVGFPFMNPLRFGPDLIKGAIGCLVAFGVTLALSLIFGFESKTNKN